MPRNPNKTPCAIPGCRAWAIRGSDPPRCAPHRHIPAESRPPPAPFPDTHPNPGPPIALPPAATPAPAIDHHPVCTGEAISSPSTSSPITPSPSNPAPAAVPAPTFNLAQIRAEEPVLSLSSGEAKDPTEELPFERGAEPYPSPSPAAYPDAIVSPLPGADNEPPHSPYHEPGPRVGAPPGNQNRLIHGFYAKALHPEEAADLQTLAGDHTLDAEIAIIRVALRRLLTMLLTGVTPGPNPKALTARDYGRYAGLAFQGTGALSRLLRARNELTGGQQGAFGRIMDSVLDGLSEELGVDL